MNRKDVHRRLIASESYWFGGVRDAPKIYETGTRHHVEPIVVREGESPAVDVTASTDCYEISIDLQTGELSTRSVLTE